MSPRRADVALAPSPVPHPLHLGQATAVEQSRAAAEVLAAVQVAQQCPRNIALCMDEMRQSCSQLPLAERAFYSYPKGGKTVTGPSIHMAKELARIWGNLDYGIAELRRDDEGAHQSEMKAYAWDQQKNTRTGRTIIVPHVNGSKTLTDSREITDNNTNWATRQVREAIFSLLPPWFKDEAIALCRGTLEKGESGQRLDQRIETAVTRFGRLGISLARLESRVGREQARWTAADVAELGIVFRSIERGELRADDAFPTEPVTAEELTGEPTIVRQAPTRLVDELTGRTIVRGGIDTPIEYADDADAADDDYVDERSPEEIAAAGGDDHA